MTYDAIVIGLGAYGSATLFQLARRGAKVLGIDRYAPPHDLGSSHGETRITRLANGESAHLTDIVRRSHALWREIESETGEELLTQCGGLVISGKSRASIHVADFFANTIANARASHVTHELLDTDAIRRRFPQFRVRAGEQGYFEPEAGFVRPEACIRAQLALAKRHGAEIRSGERLLSLESDGQGVRAVTERGTYRAARAIVAAGAWLPALSPTLAPLLQVYRQVLHWFDVEGDRAPYMPGRFPIFIWELPDSADGIYGFPLSGDSSGLKVATEHYETTAVPDTVSREATAQESQAMFRLASPFLSGLGARCVKSTVCLYTLTPDRQFLIDRLPECANAIFVSACSGHGFKHSAAIGEALAQEALEGRSRFDLSPFRLKRFA
ncbi:MAG: N-methyl-L-tryptophan oxidase [Alphaproteobacteria bacterium]|nr:N-methyl-L-tryptophan oxidase [Alphaproteobacteria bacterium]MBV9693799.1 N-methyl-L-tryptophan oxidase [Alphaproteobacteria bacterium]